MFLSLLFDVKLEMIHVETTYVLFGFLLSKILILVSIKMKIKK